MAETGRTRRVAVIGAGASGLAATKCLLDEGLEVVTFEQRPVPSGIWNYDDSAADGGGPAYRSLHTNTSRETTGFSDFPLPEDLPDFPTWSQIHRYLNDYASHFNLRPHIRCGTRVRRISPQEGGRWLVETEGEAGPTGETFDGVLVCTGLYHEPRMPGFPGLDQFRGQVLHSRSYTEPEPFAGRDVVVAGIGSSGAEIASELSRGTASLTLSTRSGAWLIPRYVLGRPYDHQLTQGAERLPFRLRMRVFQSLVQREYRRLGLDPAQLPTALAAPFDLRRGRVTPGTDTLTQAAAGKLTFKPDIARVGAGSMTFVDGSTVPADTLICCTGYRLRFPFLDARLAELTSGDTQLYRYVFPPGLSNLAFTGLATVIGPYLPVAELQARWAARVFSGTASLPSVEVMRQEIAERRARQARQGARPAQVLSLEYMNQLAREIGATPKPWRHPGLAPSLLFGPPRAAQFRLDGPGRWSGAAAALRQRYRPAAGRPSLHLT